MIAFVRGVRAVFLAGLVAAASLAGCGGSSTAPGSAAPSSAVASAGLPRSVVIITIDTMRADRLTSEIAPALSTLAATAVRFITARTAVPLTLPSHTTLLTGQRPPQHGVRLNGQALAGDVPTLATALRGAGYRTAAFVGAYALDRRFGLARGFETYDDQVTRDWDAADRLEAERPAGAVVDAALAWMDRVQDGPYFLWVHLYDPHEPYRPPQPFRRQQLWRPPQHHDRGKRLVRGCLRFFPHHQELVDEPPSHQHRKANTKHQVRYHLPLLRQRHHQKAVVHRRSQAQQKRQAKQVPFDNC